MSSGIYTDDEITAWTERQFIQYYGHESHCSCLVNFRGEIITTCTPCNCACGNNKEKELKRVTHNTGSNSPIGEQCLDHEQRFFNPK